MDPKKEERIGNSETVRSFVYGEDLVSVWTVALCDDDNMIARKTSLRKCCAEGETSFEESAVEYFEVPRGESNSLYERIVLDFMTFSMNASQEVEATVPLDEVKNKGKDGLLSLLGLFGKTEKEFRNDVGLLP